MAAAPLHIPFLPSLGMAWRGMWGLAFVPAVTDDSAEADTSVDV
jgi:hypothetical protein